MTVKKEINKNTVLSEKQKAMIAKAEKKSVIYDDDSPELSDEELAEFRRVADIKRNERRKQTVTLRLSPQTLLKARSLGKGYTSVLSRILDAAMEDNDLIRKCL